MSSTQPSTPFLAQYAQLQGIIGMYQPIRRIAFHHVPELEGILEKNKGNMDKSVHAHLQQAVNCLRLDGIMITQKCIQATEEMQNILSQSAQTSSFNQGLCAYALKLLEERREMTAELQQVLLERDNLKKQVSLEIDEPSDKDMEEEETKETVEAINDEAMERIESI